MLLCILVVVCGLALLFLKYSLDDTKSNLEGAKNDIRQKEIIIESLNDKVADLQSSIASERTKREKAEMDLSDLKRTCEKYVPVIITDVQIANVYSDGSIETDYGGTLYSRSSMYVKPKITYTGINTGDSLSLDIRLYTPSGLSRSWTSPSDCSWTESFLICEGSNSQLLLGWGGASMGHWSSGIYRFEFWYGDVCLKAKSFTIQ